MKENILVSTIENGVFFITLNRPHAANALSIGLLKELKEIINSCEVDRSIRCIILSGSGEGAFCAGADLKERSLMTDYQVRDAVTLIGECINSLEELPQPVIAAINGAALGGGLELALACDFIIASETARFGLTETSLGIIPGAGGTQRLPRLIGLGKAKELIYTARKLDAREAAEIGLIQYVTKADLLKEKAIEIADRIALNAPLAMQKAKKCINKGMDVDLKTGLNFERLAYETIIPTQDRLEGLKAFKEKRLPRFNGE
ncbi:enoyl-CoA hydratase/carnithine racemase [Metabacillus crassostreae]|uniref:enoyl-CoA hydratase n=1 Tax=Metabacillus crassostreae TaxID=929098 RepID=UPI00195951DD|nr:enoyl-CoA hydratase [Metabacillus crassostreae]MBM7602290.1 enoyl-CoA hydratase/carnithine racemase [Metabacillus crassostreae]